jgi:hypothetical protein
MNLRPCTRPESACTVAERDEDMPAEVWGVEAGARGGRMWREAKSDASPLRRRAAGARKGSRRAPRTADRSASGSKLTAHIPRSMSATPRWPRHSASGTSNAGARVACAGRHAGVLTHARGRRRRQLASLCTAQQCVVISPPSALSCQAIRMSPPRRPLVRRQPATGNGGRALPLALVVHAALLRVAALDAEVAEAGEEDEGRPSAQRAASADASTRQSSQGRKEGAPVEDGAGPPELLDAAQARAGAHGAAVWAWRRRWLRHVEAARALCCVLEAGGG